MLIDRRPSPPTNDRHRPSPPAAGNTLGPGASAAVAALVVGTLYAAVSAYWGLGGTGLLSTVGGTLEREGRSGATAVRVLLWVAVLLKLCAALIGLLAVARQGWIGPQGRRLARHAAWIAALLLTAYGALLSATGLLVQLDLLHASATADRKALRWHAFLWDPWFLLWGLLLTVALTRSRSHTRQPATGLRQERSRRRSLEG